MIRKLFAVILLCSAAAMADPQGPPQGPGGSGFGRPPGPPPGEARMMLPPGRWWKDAEIAKNLALTAAQVQKIEQIFMDSRIKLIDAHAALQKEEIKLEPLLEADTPDEAAVLASIDRIAAARLSLEKANAQMAFAIRRVLSPEQWKKLRTERPQRMPFPPPGSPRGHRDGGPQQKDGKEAPSGERGHHMMPPPSPSGEQPAPEAPAQS